MRMWRFSDSDLYCVDVPQPRVDAVAEREIDDAVGAAEKHRRLGAIACQRVQTLAGPSCKQYDQRVVDHA
jgi:hypothetical protein